MSVSGCCQSSVAGRWCRAGALDCVFHVTVVRVVEGFRVVGVIDGSVPCGVLEPLATVPRIAGCQCRALGAVASMIRGVRVGGVGSGEKLEWCEGPRDLHGLLSCREAAATAGATATVEELVHAERVESVVLMKAQGVIARN